MSLCNESCCVSMCNGVGFYLVTKRDVCYCVLEAVVCYCVM